MIDPKWGWLALGVMILAVGGIFLDLNSTPPIARAELETTTPTKPPWLPQASAEARPKASDCERCTE